MAVRVSVTLTLIGAKYTADAVVGVEPSVV
jgi:hypothetical protein